MENIDVQIILEASNTLLHQDFVSFSFLYIYIITFPFALLPPTLPVTSIHLPLRPPQIDSLLLFGNGSHTYMYVCVCAQICKYN